MVGKIKGVFRDVCVSPEKQQYYFTSWLNGISQNQPVQFSLPNFPITCSNTTITLGYFVFTERPRDSDCYLQRETCREKVEGVVEEPADGGTTEGSMGEQRELQESNNDHEGFKDYASLHLRCTNWLFHHLKENLQDLRPVTQSEALLAYSEALLAPSPLSFTGVSPSHCSSEEGVKSSFHTMLHKNLLNILPIVSIH
uniref:uncharacterized protein LOC106999837 n=1 Tax=Macaca mulatta TaxID=9544 RepID=UPI0010A228BA|nr:uncharacterized protein LOC106999837 [Macaca mulatta]